MPKKVRISQGDCVSSLAATHGMLPETIWDAPDNEALRQDRPHGNALAPGDVVVVPDPSERIHEAAVDRKHRYVRKGVPEKLRLVLHDEAGEPRTGLAYQVEFAGGTPMVEGTTDGDGAAEFVLPAREARATLRLCPEDRPVEEHELRFGGVDPITTVTGVQHRLYNLGYGCPTGGRLDDATRAAILSFQSDAELTVTGELDDATRSALEERYGS
ncbi:MAG: peptidoglycan-binding protein [Myxococcales bacterium]|nr:peptidoglycan-binding protein [Myxococcales bacterium]